MDTTNESFASVFKKISKPLQPKPTDVKTGLKKVKGIKCIAFDFYGTMFISGVGDIGIDEGMADIDTFTAALDNSELTIINRDAATLGFDLYDVIVSDHRKALEKQGYDTPEPDIRAVWTDVLSSLKQKRMIQGTIDEKTVSLFAIEFEVRMNPIWPMPHLLETLDGIHDKGLEIGIISNSQFYTPIALEALTERSISDLHLNSDLLHWSYEERLKKPSKAFYSAFVNKLGKDDIKLKPSEVLYVGNDMLKDVWAASETGLKTALFAGDKRSLKWRKDDERCKNLKPDAVITELPQLLECV